MQQTITASHSEQCSICPSYQLLTQTT